MIKKIYILHFLSNYNIYFSAMKTEKTAYRCIIKKNKQEQYTVKWQRLSTIYLPRDVY